MEELQLKVRLRATLQNYISQLMGENNIPPSIMEDALEHILLDVREAVFIQYIEAEIKGQQSESEHIYEDISDEKEIEEQ